MVGSALKQTQSIVNAIEQALTKRDYKVCEGRWTVQYEAHNDGSEELGNWDERVVRENAALYVADTSIVAVIGTYNSDAAKIMIPILNQADLVMISPANTYPGLTKPNKGAEGEPDIYYPNGRRNYTRVVPADDLQGLVAAQWGQNLGAKSVFLVHNGELYGAGLTNVFEQTAISLGLQVLGHEGIDPTAVQFTAVAQKIVNLHPDLVYYGGTTQSGGALLVKDIRGAGYPGFIMTSDGMYEEAFIDIAGEAAEGVYLTFGGIPPGHFSGAAKEWAEEYRSRYGAEPEAYALYGYVSAEMLLDALDRVCEAGQLPTDRLAVRNAVFTAQDVDSIIGRFSIDANGDTTNFIMSGSQVKDGKFIFVTLLGSG
jgi:branched-chain amino acid transport system substrate-binding protein